MSLGCSRFNVLPSILAGTAAVVVSTVANATAAVAMTPPEISQVADPVTVRISDNAGGWGSGVIIAKRGNNYTVLTVNHVVQTPGLTYTIQTGMGQNYPIAHVQRLQRQENDPDLALVTFNTPIKYPIATLGNSNQAVVGAPVYISGYPAVGGEFDPEPSYRFRIGTVTSRLTRAANGYTLHYSADTNNGMSGGPIFDSSGRVIGIHGQRENEAAPREVAPEAESGGLAPIEKGFRAGIAINTFMALRAKIGLLGELRTNNTPPSTSPPHLNEPIVARDYYDRGLSRLDSGNRRGALEDFNHTLQLNPKDSSAYYNRGNVQYALGNNLKAMSDYTKAIRLNPNNASAYYNLGEVLAELGYQQGAMSDDTEAIRLEPRNAFAYYNRGVARSSLGDYRGAIKDYTHTIQLSPKFALAYNNQGRAYYNIGNNQEAIKYYTKAIQLNPKFALAYNNLGKARNNLRDRQGAMRDYEEAIRFFPFYSTAYYNLGVVQYELKDKQGAIKNYTKAIKFSHYYTEAYYNRGVARHDLGDKRGSLADLQQAANIYHQEGNKAQYQHVLATIRALRLN